MSRMLQKETTRNAPEESHPSNHQEQSREDNCTPEEEAEFAVQAHIDADAQVQDFRKQLVDLKLAAREFGRTEEMQRAIEHATKLVAFAEELARIQYQKKS